MIMLLFLIPFVETPDEATGDAAVEVPGNDLGDISVDFLGDLTDLKEGPGNSPDDILMMTMLQSFFKRKSPIQSKKWIK